MKHKMKLYIILVFIQMLSCAFAQQMSVTTLPLNNYLPSSTVLRVHCDREGFLWLGRFFVKFGGTSSIVNK